VSQKKNQEKIIDEQSKRFKRVQKKEKELEQQLGGHERGDNGDLEIEGETGAKKGFPNKCGG